VTSADECAYLCVAADTRRKEAIDDALVSPSSRRTVATRGRAVDAVAAESSHRTGLAYSRRVVERDSPVSGGVIGAARHQIPPKSSVRTGRGYASPLVNLSQPWVPFKSKGRSVDYHRLEVGFFHFGANKNWGRVVTHLYFSNGKTPSHCWKHRGILSCLTRITFAAS
jgi:hypothetical protein